jgi:hypothetical protein
VLVIHVQKPTRRRPARARVLHPTVAAKLGRRGDPRCDRTSRLPEPGLRPSGMPGLAHRAGGLPTGSGVLPTRSGLRSAQIRLRSADTAGELLILSTACAWFHGVQQAMVCPHLARSASTRNAP